MIGLCVATFLLVTISSVSCCSSETHVIGDERLPWISAYINCRKNGMDLAVIGSREEEEQIEALVKQCDSDELKGYKKGLWISLSKPGLDPNNEWHWFRTGKKLNDSTYFNWAEGKPGNPAAKCAKIAMKNKKFVWSNLMCKTILPYICQDRISDCE